MGDRLIRRDGHSLARLDAWKPSTISFSPRRLTSYYSHIYNLGLFPGRRLGCGQLYWLSWQSRSAWRRPARAENPMDGDRSLSELLPLFDKNDCKEVRDAAGQLFCGDPELNAASARLNSAVQDRMSRLPDRRLAVEENAEWIRLRNSSCGVFRQQSVRAQAIQSAKACLSKETEERIEILNDPNFDCLASNTTAGMLICSEPALKMRSG